MNGNHAAGVFADALNKGLRFDVEKAFEGMKHTVMRMVVECRLSMYSPL